MPHNHRSSVLPVAGRTSKQEIEAAEVEINTHLKADMRTVEVVLNIIELLQKYRDFMRLEGFELKKAQLLKSMLPNP